MFHSVSGVHSMRPLAVQLFEREKLWFTEFWNEEVLPTKFSLERRDHESPSRWFQFTLA